MTGLDEALEVVREPLVADGADLQLLSFEDGEVVLQLVVTDASCQDCILPREALETVILVQLQETLPSVGRVTLCDPREEGSAA